MSRTGARGAVTPIGAPAETAAPIVGARARRARTARVAIGLLTLVLAWACVPYLAGLLGAIVLHVLCAPAYRRLAPRLGSRGAAVLITVAATLLLVVPMLALVAGALQQAPVALAHVARRDVFDRAATLHVGPVDIGAQIARTGDAALAWISSRALHVAGSVTRATLNLLIAVVGLYYLMPSARTLWHQVSPFVPFSRAGTEALRERFVLVTEATLLGLVAASVSQELVVGLAFWAVGLPNPLVWGVVTGVTSVLPILGASLVWLPGVVVLVVDGRYGAATALGLIGLVIASNIDNVVLPSIYRRVSGIHPMATLVGAFAGVELLGVVGLLLGPLAITYTLELIRLYRAEYVEA
jgi:predicted PurR-regulated permease PerM